MDGISTGCKGRSVTRWLVVRVRVARIAPNCLRASFLGRPPRVEAKPFVDRQSPSTTPAGTTSDEPYNEQQHNSTDCCVDDCADDADAEMNAQLWQQPTSNKSTDNSDNQIADKSKPGSTNELASQPAITPT